MNPRQILERERGLATYAGLASIAVPVLFIGSTALITSIAVPDGLATDEISSFDTHSTAIFAASVLRALGLAAMAVPLYFLFRATQARSERVHRAMVGFVILAPVFLAAQSILFYVGQSQLSSDFVAAAAPGGDVYTLLDNLAEDNSLLLSAGVAGQLAGLALIVAMIYVPLQAMRVGLLTRFFATLGMALGVAAVLLPALTPLPLTLWFSWLGFVILNRVPRGRPPAWDAGIAIPWPTAGKRASEPEPQEVMEGDATEVFADNAEPKDQTSRRERAKKRKRKRRR
jgi:hypothetical protein